MIPQEQAQLQRFLETLVAAKGVNKLPDADRLIRQAIASQPDAAYLLVQRCMLLEQGLAQAKARIAELEDSQAPARSFFGSSASPVSPSAYAPAGPPSYAGPAYGAPAAGSGFGSFLGQAAATAAGVAGGEFLFEGLEHLFGRQQPGFGSESFLPNENVTVNNFYEGRDDGHADDDTPVDDDVDFDDDTSSDSGSEWT